MPEITCSCGYTIKLTDIAFQKLAKIVCPECGEAIPLQPSRASPAADALRSTGSDFEFIDEDSSAIAAKFRQRPSRVSPLLIYNGLLVVVIVAFAFWAFSQGRLRWPVQQAAKQNEKPANQFAALIPPKDKHLEEVRNWLRENTHSGEWEEVRWWPVRDVKTQFDGVVHAARLKFRTQFALGKRLNDDVFVFDDRGRLDWSHASTTSPRENAFTATTVREIVESIDNDDRNKE